MKGYTRKKILFITLSNIGDVILTLPVLDRLLGLYPDAEITVISGPGPREIFEDNPAVSRLIVYDKHSSLLNKIQLFGEVSSESFDLIIDLRNTLFGICLKSRHKTNPFISAPKDLRHAVNRHLFKIRGLIGGRINHGMNVARGLSFNIRDDDRSYIDNILKDSGINDKDRLLVVAPGARSSTKRWPEENFREVIRRLKSRRFSKIVLVGDEGDIPVCEAVSSGKKEVLNLCAKTSLRQLGALLKRGNLLLTNDSATMHLASYLKRPVLSIFGPTDEKRYGPWSNKSVALRKNLDCTPCQSAQCQYGTLECLKSITVDEVIDAIKKFN